MIRTLIQLATGGNATQAELLPDLPRYSRGLPMLTDAECASGCRACVETCPTNAISLANGAVTLDRGECIGCGGCTDDCPTGTIAPDRRTDVAVLNRADLVLTNAKTGSSSPSLNEVGHIGRSSREAHYPSPGRTEEPGGAGSRIWTRSLHVREVSTGDNATDLEVAAANNPVFDASRFGVHFVASPRYADALLVTGPVARAMREPLRRCWEAMAEPRIVIAAGTAAISGGLFAGGYAEGEGVGAVLPVTSYIPGNPPHPWYILHGLLLAMGHPVLDKRR